MDRAEKLINHVESSIAAVSGTDPILIDTVSGIDPDVLNVEGFSTKTQRYLTANLCSLPKITYLELGLFHGGTFCAAINANPELIAVGVDDFSQDFSTKDVRQSLMGSLDKFGKKNWHFIEGDAFNLGNILPKNVDILFYDAVHSEEAQCKAMTHFIDNLSDEAIIIVDDADWIPVITGTRQGLKNAGDRMRVLKEWHLTDGRHDGPKFHNGLLIFVIQKI